VIAWRATSSLKSLKRSVPVAGDFAIRLSPRHCFAAGIRSLYAMMSFGLLRLSDGDGWFKRSNSTKEPSDRRQEAGRKTCWSYHV